MHKEHLIIINLMDKWWRMEVGNTLRNSLPMSTGPDIPLKVMQLSTIVYNATTEVMIKNRNGPAGPGAKLSDAVLLRMWLEDDLPVFEYKSYEDLSRKYSDWCVTEEVA